VFLAKEKKLEKNEQENKMNDTKYVAVKRVVIKDSSIRTNMKNEINIIKKFNHENIVRYENHFIPANSYEIYVVMEMCEYGSLWNLIKFHVEKKISIKEEVNYLF
jgi:serine/threonine protein kinase